MRKVNELLLISIFILSALLAAVVGLKVYDTYMADREQEEKEFAAVLARNAEAQQRVAEMEAEIQEMAKNPQALERFMEDLQNMETADLDGLTVSDSSGYGEETVSGSDEMSGHTVSDNMDVSANAVSGKGSASANAVSGNGSVSANTVSGNGSVSVNTVSGNGSVSANTVSGDGSVSANTVSENSSVSQNAVSGNVYMVDGLVQPEISLDERRKLHTSSEETLAVNRADQERIIESRIDFSGKKIACLGDSITAAANLDSEENYQQYSYPANLKEILGAEEVYNLGIGGSSIGRYWADAFVDRYQEIPEDVDIIIVMGGTNDGFCVADQEFGSLDERKYRTFCGDLDELMRGLRDNYPDADVFFVTPLPNILQDYLMSERDYLLPQKNFVNVILTLAWEYDFEVIDLYNSNLLDSHDVNIVKEYMPDGVHGNHDGYRILAEHFAAELVRYYEDGEHDGEAEQISGNSLVEDSETKQISDNSMGEDGEAEQISDNAVEQNDKAEQISGNAADEGKRRKNSGKNTFEPQT